MWPSLPPSLPQVALESFNTTHTINTLAFGDRPPAGHASPKHMLASAVLEGHHKTVQDTHAMHQVTRGRSDKIQKSRGRIGGFV